MGRLFLFGFLLATSACGSDGDGGGNGNGNGPGSSVTCAPDEFAIEGSLDGEPVSHRGALRGHAWIQSSAKSSLDTPFEGGGSFHAEWQGLVADGETFAATGNVNLPVSGPHGGETLDYSAGSVKKVDETVSFEISGLSLNVQCVTAPCPSGAVAGTLSGCVHWAPFNATP